MSSIRSLAKNSVSSIIIKISTPLGNSILFLLIARTKGVLELGQYSTALALLYIVQAICAFGFPYLITLQVARDNSKAEKYFVHSAFISTIVSILMMLFMCLTAYFIAKNRETFIISVILSISLLPYGLTIVLNALCRGFERYDLSAIPAVIGNIVKLLLAIVFIFWTGDLKWIAWSITIHYFIIFLFSMILTFRYTQLRLKGLPALDFPFCLQLVRSSVIFIIILFLGTLKGNISSLLLNNLLGESEVGLYNAGFKVVTLFSILITGYTMALQPVIFRLAKVPGRKLHKTAFAVIRFLQVLIIPLVVITLFIKEQVFLFLYNKPEYLNSLLSFTFLIFSLLFLGFNQFFSHLIIANKQQRINLYANIIENSVLIVFSLILIPFLNIDGAAIAFLLSNFIAFLYQYQFINKKIFPLPLFRFTLKPLLAALATGCLLFLIRNWNFILIFMSALVCYFVLLLSVKTFSRAELAVFKSMFRKKVK